MPSGGVGLRKLTSFAPTGHERLVVVKYERDSEEELLRSLQRAEALKEFCKTNPHDSHSSNDVLLNNCQHFASLCCTGRRESWQLKAAAEAVLEIFASATKNIAQSKDVKYQHGLGLLLAAAKGHLDIIKIFVSAGVDDPHTLTLASRIALVNKHFEDAAYLLAWADMYASGRVPPNHNVITANIDGCRNDIDSA
eukprot:gene21760-28783_t